MHLIPRFYQGHIKMAALEEFEDIMDMKAVIEGKLSQGLTYADISRQLQDQYPNVKGFSIRSIERFCASHGLHKTSRLSRHELQKVVTTAVYQVKLRCPLIETQNVINEQYMYIRQPHSFSTSFLITLNLSLITSLM